MVGRGACGYGAGRQRCEWGVPRRPRTRAVGPMQFWPCQRGRRAGRELARSHETVKATTPAIGPRGTRGLLPIHRLGSRVPASIALLHILVRIVRLAITARLLPVRELHLRARRFLAANGLEQLVAEVES